MGVCPLYSFVLHIIEIAPSPLGLPIDLKHEHGCCVSMDVLICIIPVTLQIFLALLYHTLIYMGGY